MDELRCTVDPTRVSQLISLEISTISKGNRQSLASVNSFPNNQQSIVHSKLDITNVREVSFDGRIDLLNATSSYLSINTKLLAVGNRAFCSHAKLCMFQVRANLAVNG